MPNPPSRKPPSMPTDEVFSLKYQEGRNMIPAIAVACSGSANIRNDESMQLMGIIVMTSDLTDGIPSLLVCSQYSLAYRPGDPPGLADQSIATIAASHKTHYILVPDFCIFHYKLVWRFPEEERASWMEPKELRVVHLTMPVVIEGKRFGHRNHSPKVLEKYKTWKERLQEAKDDCNGVAALAFQRFEQTHIIMIAVAGPCFAWKFLKDVHQDARDEEDRSVPGLDLRVTVQNLMEVKANDDDENYDDDDEENEDGDGDERDNDDDADGKKDSEDEDSNKGDYKTEYDDEDDNRNFIRSELKPWGEDDLDMDPPEVDPKHICKAKWSKGYWIHSESGHKALTTIRTMLYRVPSDWRKGEGWC